jgi:hypothetical protein
MSFASWFVSRGRFMLSVSHCGISGPKINCSQTETLPAPRPTSREAARRIGLNARCADASGTIAI